MSQPEPITSKLTVLGKVILLLLVTQITVVWDNIRLVVLLSVILVYLAMLN